jgi:ribonuclease HI
MAGDMPVVEIYTDGACSGNPGPGGWAAVLLFGEHRKELSGGEPSTTNNRMELLAAIRALEELRVACKVKLYTDSRYLADAMTKGWAERWRRSGWMRTKTEHAKNPDLWQRLLDLCKIHEVEFIWLRGHGQSKHNNRCDELAVAESRRFIV